MARWDPQTVRPFAFACCRVVPATPGASRHRSRHYLGNGWSLSDKSSVFVSFTAGYYGHGNRSRLPGARKLLIRKQNKLFPERETHTPIWGPGWAQTVRGASTEDTLNVNEA
jgi:hypothetical protein